MPKADLRFKNQREARRFIRFLQRRKGGRERLVEFPVTDQFGPGLSLPANTKGRSVHVHFEKRDREVIAHAHSEPDTIADTSGHLEAIFDPSKIDYPAGARALRGYRRDFKQGTCRRCGRTIWSVESLRTRLGSYCRTRA